MSNEFKKHNHLKEWFLTSKHYNKAVDKIISLEKEKAHLIEKLESSKMKRMPIDHIQNEIDFMYMSN